MNDRNFVTSLSRGLKILESFSPERPLQNLQEISKGVELPRTTVFRLLSTLVKLGYVRYDNRRKEYYLGPRVMSLGFSVLNSMDIKDVARPYLEDFAEETGENINLGVLDGTHIIYIDHIKSRRQRSISPTVIGTTINLHLTSIGHAMLAFISKEKQDEVIAALFADETIAKELNHDPEAFLNKLMETRKRGFALVNETFVLGIRSIGAAILDKNGYAIAAINLPMYSKSVTMKKLSQFYGASLVRTAKKISENMGFTGAYPGLKPFESDTTGRT